MKKNEIQFFPSKTRIVDKFYIFVVTDRGTNFLPKLVHMPLFSAEKTEFPFFISLFSGIANLSNQNCSWHPIVV